jgi:hypothetical protein
MCSGRVRGAFVEVESSFVCLGRGVDFQVEFRDDDGKVTPCWCDWHASGVCLLGFTVGCMIRLYCRVYSNCVHHVR